MTWCGRSHLVLHGEGKENQGESLPLWLVVNTAGTNIMCPISTSA